MATKTPADVTSCKSCAGDLAPGTLACTQCYTLVHADELAKLTADAQTLEADGKLQQSREHWLTALPLLPRTSKQAEWIEAKAHALDLAADHAKASESENKWTNKLGPVGPIAVILAKSKALLVAVFKLNFYSASLPFCFFTGRFTGLYSGLGSRQ